MNTAIIIIFFILVVVCIGIIFQKDPKKVDERIELICFFECKKFLCEFYPKAMIDSEMKVISAKYFDGNTVEICVEIFHTVKRTTAHAHFNVKMIEYPDVIVIPTYDDQIRKYKNECF